MDKQFLIFFPQSRRGQANGKGFISFLSNVGKMCVVIGVGQAFRLCRFDWSIGLVVRGRILMLIVAVSRLGNVHALVRIDVDLQSTRSQVISLTRRRAVSSGHLSAGDACQRRQAFLQTKHGGMRVPSERQSYAWHGLLRGRSARRVQAGLQFRLLLLLLLLLQE